MSYAMSINAAIPQSIINNVGNASEANAASVETAVGESVMATANSQVEMVLQLLPDVNAMMPTTNNPPNLGQNFEAWA